VSCSQPLPLKRSLTGRILVQVCECCCFPPDEQVPDLALRHVPPLVVLKPHLVPLDRLTCSTGPDLTRSSHDEHVKVLGRAEAIHDLHSRPLLPGKKDRSGQSLPCRHAEAQRAKVV